MARREVVELTDDVDGSPASQTIRFAIEGVEYEIDLSAKNAQKFHSVLQTYVDKGRRVGGRQRAGGRRSSHLVGTDPKVIRQWAAEHGVRIRSRGRIPGEIVEQYIAVNGG